MNRHSSYSAPRSERSSGSYNGQRGRSSKRNTYNKRSWKDNRTLFILVCFILPFIAVNLIIVFMAVSTPRIEYNVSDTQDYKTVNLSIKVHSLLPLKQMSVTLESQPIQMDKAKGEYTATITQNGTLEILVTGWNGMTKRAFEHIATLDDAPPTIDQDNYVMENGQLTVTAGDSQSGVNYDAAYGVDENGETVKPASVNKDTGEITFPMDTSSLTVYIEDFAGNTAKASFSNHTVGIDTGSRNTQFPSDGKNGTNGNVTTAKGNSDSKKSSGTAKETTKASKSTDKAKETTKAAKSADKAKETTKASKSADKAKETTKAANQAKETTKAANQAKETTKANESSAASTQGAKPTESAPVPGAPMIPGGEGSGSPTQAPPPAPPQALPQTSQPAAPGDSSNGITVVPLS